MLQLSLEKKALAYSATSLGNALISSVFSFYYVKIYLNLFHVSESWFQLSQIVFMVWNAVNDPLFGYIQDNFKWRGVESRRHSILYGAPIFVFAFILIWFPWDPSGQTPWISGLQLMFVLCFYDTLFTFVLLAQCALFAELSSRHEDRLSLVRYSKMASLLGSGSVFFCEIMSNNLEDFGMFQVACCILGFLSLLCMTYTGLNAYTKYDIAAKADPGGQKEEAAAKKEPEYSICRQSLQIMKQRSFISFVLMNFCQIYNSTFLVNFSNIICDEMIRKNVLSSFSRSVFYGSLQVFPDIAVIIGIPYVGRVGYYKVIRASFVITIATGLALFFVGPEPWMFMVYFFIQRAVAVGIFALFNLCLSDVIDRDQQRYRRGHPMSSMVFGLNALITKPAMSLAPMVTVAILNSKGYENLQRSRQSALGGATAVPHALHDGMLYATMFYTCVLTPIIVGLLQMVIWSFYTIRSSHVTTVGRNAASTSTTVA